MGLEGFVRMRQAQALAVCSDGYSLLRVRTADSLSTLCDDCPHAGGRDSGRVDKRWGEVSTSQAESWTKRRRGR